MKKTNKVLAILLVVAMLIGLLPATALAGSSHDGQVRVIVENTTYTEEEGALWDGVLVDTWVDIDSDSTMMSSVVAALDEVSAAQEGAESNYISSINGLAAFDGGDASGWMGTLNDWFTNVGFGEITVAAGTLEAGDEIRIMYTLEYGEDLGGSWSNNDKTLKAVSFSTGELSPAFDRDTYSYTLTVPSETTGIVVTPTASNKNFQVRTSIGTTEYKRTATVPVENGTVISIKCGDPSWPSMNGGSYGSADSVPAETYTFTVAMEDGSGSTNNAATLKDDVSATAIASVTLGNAYTLDLSTIFTDADDDVLSYKVSVNSSIAVAAHRSYSYTPDAAGTYTLVFTANDGTVDSSDTYTVTLTAEAPTPEYAKLSKLLVFNGTSPSKTNVLLMNTDDLYGAPLVFDPAALSYTLATQTDSTTQLRFRAIPEDEGDTVTIHYYGGGTKDITWNGNYNSYQWANCLTAGRNVFTIVVTPAAGSDKMPTTYTFTIDCVPTLNALCIGNGSTQYYLDKTFNATTTEYTVTVPSSATTVNVNATPTSGTYAMTYNGNASSTVDISSADKIDIVVTCGAGENALENTYTINLAKVAQLDFKVSTTPLDAVVKVYDQTGSEVAANGDGSYSGLFGTYDYTYTVTKYGYVAQSGTVPKTGGALTVTLTAAADDGLLDVGAYWKNFRGNDNNMAITDVELPTDTETINLKWNSKLGTGWSAAPSVQIIVDNALVVMCGTTIYKLDLQTGETLVTGTMVAAPNWGYTPPIYAEGMIFAPLTGGVVQAFNADTLQSLWVYRDNLGGQSLSPIAYDDGYIYTGFWNSETRNANFVCLSVTDEDIIKTDEAKAATWKRTQLGGFYWAGAVVVGDAVIVGTDDGTSGSSGAAKLYSFNQFTGAVISELGITGDQRSSIAYDESSGRIYFTTKCGYLYSAHVNASTGKLSGLKGVTYNAQSTSTPVVYKGKVYIGVGSGISSTGSSGNLLVADANSLEMLYTVGLKGYPQCSMLLTTAYEDETGYIYLYSTYNAMPGGISMIKVDPDATTAAGAELNELYDAAGFQQYCISSLICGADGTIYYKNDSGNILAVGIPKAVGVMKLINAIGTVTLNSGNAIMVARNAYDVLSDAEKANVTNYATLTAAESAYSALQVENVETLIGLIGVVTLDSQAAIAAARNAYDALSDTQKALVTNAASLMAAETKYAQLKAATEQAKIDEAAAADVEKLINAIGDVTLDSEKDIKAARAAYNALTSAQKRLVPNYSVLKAAETALALLKATEKTEQVTVTLEEEDSSQTGTSGTESVTINGVTYTVDTQTAGVMTQIEGLVADGNGESDINSVISTYLAFQELTDDQKLFVANYDKLEAYTQAFAEQNHTDEATGISASGLDWYIQVRTTAHTLDSQEAAALQQNVSDGNKLLMMVDISLYDLINDTEYEPGQPVTVRLPAPDMSGYDGVVIIHQKDDGTIEYIEAAVEGDELVFTATSFSSYGIVGYNGRSPLELVSAPDLGWLIWAGAGIVLIAALIVLLVLQKRKTTASETRQV